MKNRKTFSNEPEYQAYLKNTIRQMIPGCIILKNDPNDIQGIPDLSIFWLKKWAWLEVKISKDASHRPNQDYYVDWGKWYSFGAFIYPENEEQVLNDLKDYLLS